MFSKSSKIGFFRRPQESYRKPCCDRYHSTKWSHHGEIQKMFSSAMNSPKLLLSDQALMRRENFNACIHEAGHVVAARYFGFPVAWVSYDIDFLQNDRMAIDNECASGEPVTMTIASPVLEPILKRGFAASQAEREIVRGYCTQVLAGPAAEIDNNPDAAKAAFERDFWQVGTVIKRVHGKGFQARRLKARFFKDAINFVMDHDDTIIRFAAELFNRRTIMASDIDVLLAKHGFRASSPILSDDANAHLEQCEQHILAT